MKTELTYRERSPERDETEAAVRRIARADRRGERRQKAKTLAAWIAVIAAMGYVLLMAGIFALEASR